MPVSKGVQSLNSWFTLTDVLLWTHFDAVSCFEGLRVPKGGPKWGRDTSMPSSYFGTDLHSFRLAIRLITVFLIPVRGKWLPLSMVSVRHTYVSIFREGGLIPSQSSPFWTCGSFSVRKPYSCDKFPRDWRPNLPKSGTSKSTGIIECENVGAKLTATWLHSLGRE